MAFALEAIRRDRNLTQAQVAEAIGVNTPKYQAWESLSAADLTKLAAVLKVNVKDIRIPR